MINAYHGSKNKITKFSDEFVGGKEASDKEGVGIYFSSSKEDAEMYGEYIYHVELHPRKLYGELPSSKKLEPIIRKMVKLAPEWKYNAMDYHHIPEIGLNQFIKSTLDYNDTEKDCIQHIWIDFYRYRPIDFVRNMVKMGVDGIEVNKNDGVKHYIIYNPDIIRIA